MVMLPGSMRVCRRTRLNRVESARISGSDSDTSQSHSESGLSGV